MKLWTVDEANAALPYLREILPTLIEQKKRADLARASLHELEQRVRGDGEGAGPELEDRRTRLREALGRLRRGLEQVTRMGCVVKDLEIGLIDFPAELGGRRVYLCWRLGEPSVLYWHALDGSFAGRRPL
jgi:hypothetical protein